MVEDEQGLVGTIGVMDRGDSAQLRWFSVRPDWRENNLGNFLFGAAMEYIQENDFFSLFLSTYFGEILRIPQQCVDILTDRRIRSWLISSPICGRLLA